MSITAAENNREKFAANLENKIDSQRSVIADIPRRQSKLSLGLKEQKETLKKMQKAAETLMKHSRVIDTRANAQDETMEKIQSGLTQANEGISSILAKMDSAITEQSEIPSQRPILDFAIKTLQKINTETMAALSLALLFTNTYKASVGFHAPIWMVEELGFANHFTAMVASFVAAKHLTNISCPLLRQKLKCVNRLYM